MRRALDLRRRFGDQRPSARRWRALPWRVASGRRARRSSRSARSTSIAAEPAFGEQERDLGGQRRRMRVRRFQHHAGEPRRQRQLPQSPAPRRDAAVAVERAELLQAAPCASFERRRRRRIEEGERRRIGDAPVREIKHQAAEIGGENFRARRRLERGGLRLVPQPVADAGLGTSGAAAPLVGGGARHPHRLEPRQADAWLVARHPRQARNRSRRARPRWSARFRRSTSPARPCAGQRARAQSPDPAHRQSSAPYSGTISTVGSLTRSRSSVSVRRISAAPGRKTSSEPGSARSARSDGVGDLRPRSARCGSRPR